MSICLIDQLDFFQHLLICWLNQRNGVTELLQIIFVVKLDPDLAGGVENHPFLFLDNFHLQRVLFYKFELHKVYEHLAVGGTVQVELLWYIVHEQEVVVHSEHDQAVFQMLGPFLLDALSQKTLHY